MKKYGILFATTAVALGICIATPGWVQSRIPIVNVREIAADRIELSVAATGRIEFAESQVVATSMPVVLRSVTVSQGQQVKKGDVLAEVDQSATLSQLTQLQSVVALQSSDPSAVPKQFTAPADGIVSAVPSAVGEPLPSGTLFQIGSNSHLQARIRIAEELISRVATGQKVILTGSGFPDRQYVGTITEMDSSAKQVSNGTSLQTVVEAVVNISEPDEHLKPGFTVKARIITEQADGVTLVPYEAIMQDEGNREFVYKVLGSEAFRQYIRTGREVDAGVEVLEGVQKGERLVLHPTNLQGDRQTVVVEGEAK